MSLNLANLCRKSNKNKGLSKCKHGTSYVKYTINNDRSSCLIFEKTIEARAYYINDDSPMISSLQERSIIGYGYTPTLTSKAMGKYYSIER